MKERVRKHAHAEDKPHYGSVDIMGIPIMSEKSMDVDLKILLKKYIDMIVAHEGTDYLNFMGDEFTEAERVVLREIAGWPPLITPELPSRLVSRD